MTWDEWEPDPWATSVRSCCTGCGESRLAWFPACVLADLLLALDREGNLEAVRGLVLNFEPGDSSWLCGECLDWGVFASVMVQASEGSGLVGAGTGPVRRGPQAARRRGSVRRRHR